MTDQPTYNNGVRQGRTEATLEGIAEKLDVLTEKLDNCPKGKEQDKKISRHDLYIVLLGAAVLLTHPEQVIWLIKCLVKG